VVKIDLGAPQIDLHMGRSRTVAPAKIRFVKVSNLKPETRKQDIENDTRLILGLQKIKPAVKPIVLHYPRKLQLRPKIGHSHQVPCPLSAPPI